MAEPTAAHARDLGDYVSLVRRRWIGVVASVLVRPGSVAGLPERRAADLRLHVEGAGQVDRVVGDLRRCPDQRRHQPRHRGAAGAVRAGRGAGWRAAGVRPDSPWRWPAASTVSVPPNTTVLAISFQAGSAADAQDGASAFAQAYLEKRQATAQDVPRRRHRPASRARSRRSSSRSRTPRGDRPRGHGAGDHADRAFLMARRENLSNQLASYNAAAGAAGRHRRRSRRGHQRGPAAGRTRSTPTRW